MAAPQPVAPAGVSVVVTDEPLSERDEDAALAAEYALGLLAPPEARAFEVRLAVDPAFRALYAIWAGDLAALTDDIAPVTPPKSIESALNAELFPEEKQGWLQSLGLFPALLGGLLAALLVLYVSNLGILGPDPAIGPRFAATIAAEDGSLVVLALFDPAAGTLQIDRQVGDARTSRVLELWLIAGGAAPVSLGVIARSAETITVNFVIAAEFADAVLAITDEPPGGSPTGAPMGEILAVGSVTLL